MSNLAELRGLVEAMTAADVAWTVKPTSRPDQSLMVRGDDYRASTQLPTEDAIGIVALRNNAIALLDEIDQLRAVCEAAEAVAELSWRSSVSENEHFARIDKVETLRAALEKFGRQG